MRKIVAPLVLLASVSLLTTSCSRTDTPVPVVPESTTETPVPVEVAPMDQTHEGHSDMSTTGSTQSTMTTPSPKSVVYTRTETVTYASPASPQDPVEFSITVTDGVITAASATPKSENGVSKNYQSGFSAEVGSKVIGKKARDLDIDAVAGASLTTGAFEMFARSF